MHNRRTAVATDTPSRMDTLGTIEELFLDSSRLKQECARALAPAIARAAERVTGALLAERKLLVCGNGGSAADAQHLAGELLNRFERERPALPAIALPADSATLTAIANDYSYDEVFGKQVRALGQPGDVLLCFTTSGASRNILAAIAAAHERALAVVLITGRDGGEAAQMLREEDILICVPSWSTARIQEVHVLITHCLCHLVDAALLGTGADA